MELREVYLKVEGSKETIQGIFLYLEEFNKENGLLKDGIRYTAHQSFVKKRIYDSEGVEVGVNKIYDVSVSSGEVPIRDARLGKVYVEYTYPLDNEEFNEDVFKKVTGVIESELVKCAEEFTADTLEEYKALRIARIHAAEFKRKFESQ